MRLEKRLRLYVITDGRLADEVEGTEKALKGGATAIQLRMKNAPTRKMIEVGKKLRKLTEEYDALFFVNDRVDVALAVDADGAHLGQEDMQIEIAREIAPDLIFGVSASSVQEALEAEKGGADYIGAGAVFPTSTKSDAEFLGIDGLQKVVRRVRIPVVAIGGINHENVLEVLRRGAHGVAVISAIMGAENIEEATRRMREIIDEFFREKED
ncbi:MAG: thiamine-phosphate pyrophosphorylase [Archaeoglobi archaeon]|nr:thiamine phosphate synthase [Candidatus Mnemosynella bozhongmuii]MDI3502887.1 thiamine-phosphate pyrophosphorylase [Archaeoglobi archaeon]MDK2781314.1 thiamine-phosphate pyrophosphorylase [Archaeoglobi archaeon]